MQRKKMMESWTFDRERPNESTNSLSPTLHKIKAGVQQQCASGVSALTWNKECRNASLWLKSLVYYIVILLPRTLLSSTSSGSGSIRDIPAISLWAHEFTEVTPIPPLMVPCLLLDVCVIFVTSTSGVLGRAGMQMILPSSSPPSRPSSHP